TGVGPVAAVVLGGLALAEIGRAGRGGGEGGPLPRRLTGAGFALFGIVAGLGFTALTIFALLNSELPGLGWVRERTLAASVDTSGPLPVSGPRYTITPPPGQWGKGQGNPRDHPPAPAPPAPPHPP